MANDSKTLFQTFVKRGLSDRDALFALIDHWNNLHWHDRDRYHERTKVLEAENAELKARVDRLEKPSEPA